jgi:hypothetical protein
VVKLFAKHIKFDEQREELSHDVRVVIGTPHRLLRLSAAGYLKWNRAKLIVWDIGKTRKLQVAELQQKRRNKNKIKKGIHVENPTLGELSDAQKGQWIIGVHSTLTCDSVSSHLFLVSVPMLMFFSPLCCLFAVCSPGNDFKMFTLITMKDTKSQLWQLYEQYLADVVVKKKSAKIVLL